MGEGCFLVGGLPGLRFAGAGAFAGAFFGLAVKGSSARSSESSSSSSLPPPAFSPSLSSSSSALARALPVPPNVLALANIPLPASTKPEALDAVALLSRAVAVSLTLGVLLSGRDEPSDSVVDATRAALPGRCGLKGGPLRLEAGYVTDSFGSLRGGMIDRHGLADELSIDLDKLSLRSN